MFEREQVVEALRGLVPPSLFDKAVVAGSFAVAPDKAEDIDLWVLGTKNLILGAQHIRHYLRQEGYLAYSTGDAHLGEEGLYANSGDFMVAAVTHVSVGNLFIKVQVLVTTQPTLEALLGRFDITTHMAGFSLLKPDVTVMDPNFTCPSKQPRVMNFERPSATWNRINRIAPRYGFDPHPQDAELLLAGLRDEAAKKGKRRIADARGTLEDFLKDVA